MRSTVDYSPACGCWAAGHKRGCSDLPLGRQTLVLPGGGRRVKTRIQSLVMILNQSDRPPVYKIPSRTASPAGRAELGSRGSLAAIDRCCRSVRARGGHERRPRHLRDRPLVATGRLTVCSADGMVK